MYSSNSPIEQILIQGYPHLKGNNVPKHLCNEDFFSLHVGDKVNLVGDGRNSGTYRTLQINPYMTHAGTYHSTIDNQKYYCFKLPKSGVTGWNLFNQEEAIYACFVNVNNSLVGLQDFKNQTYFCYIPKFGIVNNNIKQS